MKALILLLLVSWKCAVAQDVYNNPKREVDPDSCNFIGDQAEFINYFNTMNGSLSCDYFCSEGFYQEINCIGYVISNGEYFAVLNSYLNLWERGVSRLVFVNKERALIYSIYYEDLPVSALGPFILTAKNRLETVDLNLPILCLDGCYEKWE